MQDFNFHSHTWRCGHADSDLTDEEYVQDYIRMGFRRMAFTDHCPEKNVIDTRERIRMRYGQKNEYLHSVAMLRKKYENEIEILSGFEVEYLPGEEENLRELKAETDLLILGQHFIYGEDGTLCAFGRRAVSDGEIGRYGEYVARAIGLGIPDIIAHPDMFMLGREEFGEADAKAAHTICQAAEKHGILLEINLNHIYSVLRRLNPQEQFGERKAQVRYPCRQFWEIAAQYDIRALYGIDAHYRGQIARWEELLLCAKEVLGEDLLERLNFTDGKELPRA